MFTDVNPKDLEAGRKALLSGGVGGGIPLIVERAKGALLWDTNSKEYIDCTSQAWTLNIGHCHPKVIEAVSEQIKRYTHIRTSFDTVPKLLLSKKLTEIAPGRLKKVNYCLHGSVANEGAMKLALRNKPKGKNFLSLFDGYCGRTLATMAGSWPHPNNVFLPFMGNFIRVPQAYCYRCYFNLKFPECHLQCVEFIRHTIEKGIDGEVVALIMEPIQGNGGMIDFPKEYHKAVRKLCDQYNILIIWDEMQTAFGRLGTMFASELYEVVPDIIVFGKGVAGGFPLAGTLSREDLKPYEPGDHSFTFAHFPVSMVAALVTLKVIEEENLLERCREIGAYFTKRLKEMQAKYELIGDIRGPGLMIGIELVKNQRTKEPAQKEASRFVKMGVEKGVLFGESKYLGLGNVVKIKPPIVITDAQVEKVLEVFEEIVDTLS